MAISASYDNVSQDLTVTGDINGNTITVSRNAGGTLFVNGGAVTIAGGPATVSNTDLISIGGNAGPDTISLDEINGALPAAELAGGDGNDSLTGGSGADTLEGEIGNDTLKGRAGVDMLYGGDGNDTLVGGTGDDQVFGDLGDDRLVWSVGDGSDLWEGGDGVDTAEINGGAAGESFMIAANGTRVSFSRTDVAPFTLDIGTTEKLTLSANGGDDTISTSGNLAPLISLTLDGGAGNDTILGGNGNDTLLGGTGDDFIDGNQGNDVAFLGAGADTFSWDPGDGSDTVEGQADADTLKLNASAANEVFEMSANGGRIQLTRNVGAIVMDVNGVETFIISAGAGTDSCIVNDLSGTDATSIVYDLAATIGGATGDGAVDALTVNGAATGDTVDITGSGSGYTIAGLKATIAVANSEGANDSVLLSTQGGDDSIVATTLAAGVTQLAIDGGAGNDTIFGSQGADTILGGDGNDTIAGGIGNDTAFLGAGDDVFQWSPGDGSDIVEGQGDTDELQFSGSNASENVSISPNGSRVLFTRDVAAIAMDLNGVEKIRYDALAGADNVAVGDLSGTGVTNVEVRLAAAGGGGDGAADTVTINGTGAADGITASFSAGVVSVTGLPWAVSILDAEGANDALTINGQAGDDTIDASALTAGHVSLTVNGGLGNDFIAGSAGSDFVNGGDGNDTALLGGGNDVFVWNPGDDSDIIEGQGGTDALDFNGANIAENINISANGSRVLLLRDVAAITMDINDTEVINVTALGGADTIFVDDLSGTDVTQLSLDLASTPGGAIGDGAVDTLTLTGSNAANTITLSGTSGALLTVTGLPASVTISQFEVGTDSLTVRGLDGDDTISATGFTPNTTALTIDGGSGNDTIRSNGDGTYLGGTGDDTIYAGLTSSTEVIDGGDGVDKLDTTTWNGPYTINMVTGATNYSGESFTNFENLVTGAGNDNVTGTDGANIINTQDGADTINGGAGNDRLNGGSGADTLVGGTGNDTYYVDNTSDVVTENAGEGNDKVLASASYTLAAGTEVEQLATTNAAGTGAVDLTGNEFNNVITGNAGSNVLNGAAGNDTLNGGQGSDTMVGGTGDDTFYVDNAADVVSENSGEGNDEVFTTVSYALSAGSEVEALMAQPGGTAAINLTGNEFNNTIYGNAGKNTLDGGAGADTMHGGTGNDTYIVDNLGDVVIEGGAINTDLVKASVTYTLGSNVENLILTGGGAINGTGNSEQNVITGNGTANVLDGKAGADALKGGLGDDTYIVDNAGDVVTEGASAGTDLVKSSVSFTLGANVENLTLTGAAAIDGTGNSADNVLNGNNSANTLTAGGGDDRLFGFGGDDTLNGGTGNDTLSGGAGADSFVFSSTLNASTNVDQINGFVVADDTIDLKQGVFAAAGPAGTLAPGAFATGSAATQADDRIIYDSSNGNIYYDHDGVGGAAQVEFAHVAAGLVLTNADFMIIA